MEAMNEFKTSRDFCDFLQKNFPDHGEIYVKEVYNTGDGQDSESPLFLYSGYSIIMAYLSEGGLSLKVYDKDFFIQHIRGGIFRESPDSDDFYYISFTKAKLINSFVQNIDTMEYENGGIACVVITFKDGRKLHIEHSPLVKGTMRSYITD